MTGPPINLLLGADSLLGRRSGIGRVVAQLGAELRGHPEVAALGLIAGGVVRSAELLDRLTDVAESREAGRAQTLLARVPGLAALRGRMLRARLDAAAARMTPPVLYHEPNVIARPFNGVTVVAINDLSWRVDPGFHPPARIAWLDRRLPATLAQARRFVAISAFTANEIATRLGVPRERIDVAPLAPAPIFTPNLRSEAPARFGLHPGRYVLSVSTLEPRKNFDGLLEAHDALPAAIRTRFPLVVAGGEGWGQSLNSAVAERARQSGQLRLVGHVTDTDLAALYAHCAVFAFPSLYEGFGLPVIEAMACGAPVVASATTAVGETAGEAAVLVDPHDPAAITEGLRRVLEDPAEQTRLGEAGLARAAGFTWARTVEALIATWRRALAE